jgi:pyruvate/2-oxoglutarate dehydrogenase complex dihydrolipoamide dehydrogenase (E3) component
LLFCSLPNPSFVGTGEAGKYLAWTLSGSLGLKTACIERKYYGGSCPNIACLPSKNVIHSAQIAHYARAATHFGLPSSLAVDQTVDMTVVRERKRDMVKGLMEMHAGRFQATGVEVVKGEGHFVGERTIEVSLVGENGEMDNKKVRVLRGKIVVVSTGSRAIVDGRIEGLKEANPLTHVEMLEIGEVPNHLVILGGGYVGLEFAQAMRRLGSRVSVVEHSQRILKSEDEDVSNALVEMLKKEGIDFYMSTSITKVEGMSGQQVTLSGTTTSSSPFRITGTHILVAAGRTPNTSNIGLVEHGINLTPKGHIAVDAQLHTSCPNVYAVGDCAGSPHFTHVAYDDFRIVRSAIESSYGKPTQPRTTQNRQTPSVLFTDPELAHIGLHEHAAQSAVPPIPYRLLKLPMAAFLRTRTLGETAGFAKALIGDDDRILGFTALGSGAGELLPVVQLAMSAGLKYTDIGGLILTHPTLSEGLVYLFSGVPVKKADS